MPTVIVETGALVANANSFVTRADVAAYCDNRGYAWAPSTDAVADRAVIKGGDYLKNIQRLTWRGSLITATQTMPWPRTNAGYYRGPTIPDNMVPQCVKDAQCELAYRALAGTNLQPDLARGGRVKLQKVDVIEREFFADAPSETTILAVMGILGSVIINGNLVLPVPFSAQPQDVSPFLPGQFDNPPVQYPTGVADSTSGQTVTGTGGTYPGSN